MSEQHSARIFISYKHNVDPDQPLCRRLHAALEEAGHQVFVDTELKIGVQWAAELERQIKECDFCLVLLSEAAVQSEMIAVEVRCAHRTHAQTGRAQMLPVRVRYQDALPYELNAYLEPLQYAEWNSEADDARLIQELLDAIQHARALPSTVVRTGDSLRSTRQLGLRRPRPYADPRFVEKLREPGSAVGVRSDFYVERAEDGELRRELSKPYGTTITIRAPRQTGKSSLLFRGMALAQERGNQVVFCDLQLAAESDLASLDAFVRYLADMFATTLMLDPARVDKIWQSSLGAPNKLTRVVQNLVLSSGERIMLAIDEADRLLRTDYADNFFGLVRAWHNTRARDPRWDNLDIVMVISTEPHLLIQDIAQSPFNVGLKLRLQDFTAAQVQELNELFLSPLSSRDLPSLVALLGGHPYLTHKALYLMVAEKQSWAQIAAAAPTEGSPFGDHLRRYLWMLRDEPQLREALQRLLRTGRGIDQVSYYRLLRAGLLKGASKDACAFRCQLYERYFKDRL